MPVGKKDESAHCGTQKAPELRPPGLFLFRCGKVAYALGCYRLFISVQPFADVVATTLAKTESKKDEKYTHGGTPPFCTCIGVVASPIIP